MGSPGDPPKSQKNVMWSLFGAESSEWPFSDASLTQALVFKTEQEKTKQQFYKLECVNRSIELLRTAMNAKIPGPMIANLFQGSGSGVDGSGDGSRKPQDSVSRSSSATQLTASSSFIPSKENDIAPLNYKFPPKNSSVNLHRRTNSPARIGAAAVANLAENNQMKEEDSNDLHESVSGQVPVVTNQRSPLQFRAHRRNFSLPLAKPTHHIQQEHPTVCPIRKPQEPMTSVINFGSWQSYDPAPPSMMRRQGSVRKHRKTKSASTTPNFGVIDLNVPNQVRLTDIPKTRDYFPNNENNPNEDENEFDDQRTCSEHSSKETTPIPQVTKGPNFANNLLNS
ncbi:LANO_0H06964g1_1 [Lachancea nothofagi CBS 11611]|uniref:LANO_0H06964g1_1 n=1 Tax=Lachancea nothofagi CBS 11611 TaxID=1266666 RepID=A0A1G4KLY8_9SACH|nr:LANO_0H06964g1_1 [Lachancea nothofagi CBS 11611]